MEDPLNQYSPSSHLASTLTASSTPPSLPLSTPSPTYPPLRIPFTPLQLVVISLIFAVLSLMTVAGNLFVIAAFRTEPSLRLPHNYFLLSLAVADLAVGAVSLPFFGTYVIYGYRWPMGSLACDMWLALDYTMSSASAASLLLISLDRYYSIISPLAYRSLRTRKRVCIVITAAWITAGLVWCPGIFGYPYIYGSRIVPYDDCYIQFLKTNSFLTVITALFAFFIPVCIMVVLYFRIWRVTEKRKKDLKVLMAIRPLDCGPGQTTRRLKDPKSLKKAQYLKLHCLKLRQTLKSSTKTDRRINRKSLTTSENDQNLEIQEFEDRSSVISEVQSQQESIGLDVRSDSTSDSKKLKGLKSLQKAFTCLKVRRNLKKREKSIKPSDDENVKVKTELMELNFLEETDDSRYETKCKPKRQITTLKTVQELEKNNQKTSFDCLKLRHKLTKRKICKKSIRDFQNLKTKEFEMQGTYFTEGQQETDNVKLKTKLGVNMNAEKAENMNFRAQKQKLKFDNSDLSEKTKSNETFLKDIDCSESKESGDIFIDVDEDLSAVSTEFPKSKLHQESRRLKEFKNLQDSQGETFSNAELKKEKHLKPSEDLDTKAQGICNYFTYISRSENSEMFTVEYNENMKSSWPVSNDDLGAIKAVSTNLTTKSYDRLGETNEVVADDKETIMVSVITNESIRDFPLSERMRKTIRNKDEITKNTENDITVSKTKDTYVSSSSFNSSTKKHTYCINEKDSVPVNREDLTRPCSNGLSSDYAGTRITALTNKDNKKYANDITPSNCSAAVNTDTNLHKKGHDDGGDKKNAQQTKTENSETTSKENTTQKHYNKHSYDSLTKHIKKATNSDTTVPNNSHKTNQQTNHKNHTKSTKNQRKKKRPINKRNRYRPFSSTTKSNRIPHSRYLEEQGEIYTILINIPRGEGMGRPSIRLVGGSVGFDQWHHSVDRRENLNLKSGNNNNELRNISINEWEDSDFGSESESEMIEVWEEEEEFDDNTGKYECENVNINEWVESEEEWEVEEEKKKKKKKDKDKEVVGLSITNPKLEVLSDVSRKTIKIEEESNKHHHHRENGTNEEQYERAVTSLRETSDITTGTGTGSDTIETEAGTEEVTASTTNERGQKWRKGHSAHRRMRIPDRKAAKTLSAILLVFIVTWLPYNVLALLQAFCDNCVNETLYAIGKY